jgi:hypothetical protein
MLIAKEFFIKGDKETNKAVLEALNKGLDWQIKQFKLLIEIQKRMQDNTLEKQIAEATKALEEEYQWYAKQIKINTPYWFRSMSAERIKQKEHKLNKLKLREKFIKGHAEGLSAEAINQARNYPIENLIDLDKRGFAVKNPFREEKHSSLYCKNNYAHDFGTGETYDVIDIAQQVYKLSFKDAVNKLSK